MKILSLKNITPFLTILAFFSFVFYFVYSVYVFLDKEAIDSNITRVFETYFDDAQMNYENLSVRVGTSAEIRVFDFEVYSGDRLVFEADQIRMRMPYYMVMGGEGSLNLDIYNLEVNYLHFYERLDKSAFTENETKEDFFDRSRVGVRFFDLNILVDEHEDEPKRIELEKLILRNLSTKFKTAYEVDSPVELTFPADKRLIFDLMMVGEFSLEELLEKGLFESNFFLRLNHKETLSLDGKKVSSQGISEIQGKGDVLSRGLDDFEGQVELKSDRGNFSAEYLLHDGLFQFNEIDSSLPLLFIDDLGLVELERRQVLRGVNLELLGDLGINSQLQLLPDLSFSLDSPINHEIANVSLSNNISGEIREELIYFRVDSNLLGGQITYRINGKHSFGASDLSLGRLHDLSVSASIKDINMRNAVARGQTLYDALENVYRFSRREDVPIQSFVLEFERIFFEGGELKGEGEFYIDENSSSLKLSGDYQEGSLYVFLLREEEKFNITLRLHDFKIETARIFYPVRFWDIEGRYSCRIQFNWIDGYVQETIKGHVELSARNGNLPDFEIQRDFTEGLSRFLKEDVDFSDYLNEFKDLNINFHISDQQFDIKSFDYVDATESLGINMEGKLSMNEKSESEVFLTIFDYNQEIFVLGESEAESEASETILAPARIPLRLTGKGLNLSPDFIYTIQNI